MSSTEIPNHLMGDVSLNDIRGAIIKSAAIGSHQEMISLTDMAHIIWDLHILKIETNKTTAINNSIIKTATILNELDMTDIKDDQYGQYESIKNIYNSVMYYTILASIKKHGDTTLWENGKKDFGPLIKKYWNLFCEEC